MSPTKRAAPRRAPTPEAEVLAKSIKGWSLTKRDHIRARDADGEFVFVSPAAGELLRPADLQRRAAAVLQARGVAVDAARLAAPFDSVLRYLETLAADPDRDDLMMVAINILLHCARIRGADLTTARALASGYALGRLTLLLRIYSAGSAARSRSGKAERPAARKVDHDELRDAFGKLLRAGHTEREARGILHLRGVASRATIGRATKKSVR